MDNNRVLVAAYELLALYDRLKAEAGALGLSAVPVPVELLDELRDALEN